MVDRGADFLLFLLFTLFCPHPTLLSSEKSQLSFCRFPPPCRSKQDVFGGDSASDLLMSASVSKQGLLRVAIENARAQEKQDQLERTELKLELVRERELRETLERQLSVEQKNRGRAAHRQDGRTRASIFTFKASF